jgi:GNAT superfamily N-acetyltransferase
VRHTLTLATEDEIEEIRELDAREFRGADFPHGSTWWILDHDPELGYCGAEIGPDPVRKGPEPILHLTRGVVCDALRGRGIQAAMVRKRLSWGRRRGARSAQVYTWHDNVPSMRTLARCGFIPLRAQYGFIRWERDL